ncbi:uncharacterized protein LOC106652760 [Trichogramma pretiosum]|uniref:uncharacterized protein LOC106652760 n=1 Tax=Trichogramma pretiosum TaxID=7493 RepID=UPI0006C94CEA|nr:uncharacterized protein LOC106652760 [Trichogramma pretiosum]
MNSMMYVLFLQFCLLFCKYHAFGKGQSDSDDPVFNLDHTALEKNIAAIFNKVAHSSATTKRSVPAYEAQVSQSTIHSTSPSPFSSSYTTSTVTLPRLLSRATNFPQHRESPSYAPPSRTLFTPPLPPEYANPFADKPTLRGTNFDLHFNNRRPVPPPSLTPIQERIPIKPPDLVENTTKNINKLGFTKNKVIDSIFAKDSIEMSDKAKDLNETIDFVPSLHFTSISRILSGSNGRKQDIPEILLKPISTKSPVNLSSIKLSNEKSVSFQTMHPSEDVQTSTNSTTEKVLSKTSEIEGIFYDSFNKNVKNKTFNNEHDLGNDDNDRLSQPQPKPPSSSSRVPDTIDNSLQNIVPQYDVDPFESTWKITWSLHVYVAATSFTMIALYCVYKIVRFNSSTNLLTQSYFLSIHLLITIVCMLRCFYLFYDAYNLGNSLPRTLSNVLMFLPSSLIAASFSTLTLYVSRCSSAPSLYRNKFVSPMLLMLAFVVYITLCISLYLSEHILGYTDESELLPLICRCIYIIICITLGLCYMYVYRVIRSQLSINSIKSINNHVASDCTTRALNTAVTTTIATALLFILMGFVQLYGIFGVKRVRLYPYPWLWWGWQFSVRLIELSMCSLIAWVAGLSQYQMREKQIQQHIIHPGFALFPCGSSTSTENMDDALYPTICNSNQAIKNYSIRTGKQVYDDSYPLNTLPEHINSSTFERRSGRKSENSTHLEEMPNPFERNRSETQSFCKSDGRVRLNLTPHVHNVSSGSTMLVAEDGFVRFRNLGTEQEYLDSRNSGKTHVRRNSLTCSERSETIRPAAVQKVSQSFLNSLPHVSSNVHRNKHQLYNNT